MEDVKELAVAVTSSISEKRMLMTCILSSSYLKMTLLYGIHCFHCNVLTWCIRGEGFIGFSEYVN